MTPEQLAAPNTEHAHQVALFCWMSQNFDIYPQLKWAYAIPNGGERNPAVAARLRAEGVKAGVSDICLPFPKKLSTYNNIPNYSYMGFYIEMKKPGKLKNESESQKEFGAFVTQQGYKYECCDHWEKARDLIIAYMSEG